MAVRAKFKVTQITKHAHWHGTDVKLEPVYSPVEGTENHSFWEATPNGALTMQITNKAAVDSLELGKEYYLDFTEAPVG